MAEIYHRWTAAYGVMLLTPVHWNTAPSVLQLMIDRLIHADGGNTDPSSTQGKDPQRAKQIEMDGWDYPQHLAGHAFSVVVHGDSEGTQAPRHMLVDWLRGMGVIGAGALSQGDRFIGHYQPYTKSHDALDADDAFFEETRNAARAWVERIAQLRSGLEEAGAKLEMPRQK